jgi:hypothetical protein
MRRVDAGRFVGQPEVILQSYKSSCTSIWISSFQVSDYATSQASGLRGRDFP